MARMNVLLRHETARGVITVSHATSGPLRRGMTFLEFSVPRTLADDRALMTRLSREDWQGVEVCGVETPADIEKASALMRVAEANRGLAPLSLLLLASLDTAKAALGLASFNRAIPRLAGLVFDSRTMAEAAGVSAKAALIEELRLRLPLAAKAADVIAVLKQAEDGQEQRAMAARDGYAGLCIDV